MTRLDRPLKREVIIEGKPWVLTITTEGFRLVPKGRRKGRELAWRDLVSGNAALAIALNASLEGAATTRARAAPPRARR